MHRFERPACVIVKHANPCGVAVHDDITTAYERAHACDPVSAFGGIVALNRPVPEELARALAPVFTEVVVAPGYDEAALGHAHGEAEPARADGDRRRPRQRSTSGPWTAACSSSRPTRSPSIAARGGSSRPASRPTSSGTTSSSRGRCARPCRPTPSCSPATSRRSGSAPASRTASTRPASPSTGPATGPSAASAPATPSSRSATGSTPWRRAGVTAVIQPGRQRPRRRGHRGRRRARHRDGLHGRTPLPALTPASVRRNRITTTFLRTERPLPDGVPVLVTHRRVA